MNANPIVGDGTSPYAWNTSRQLAALEVVTPEQLVPAGARAVIISPHPDDEILACAGLLQRLARAQRPLLLISVTDGCASHPGSRYWTPHRLARVRPQESAVALARLGLSPDRLTWLRGGFPDTAVARHETDLQDFLERNLQPGDVVFTTWHEDGHSDHDAVGRASLAAARKVGARVHELPVWAWHWASPEDPRLPWQRARKLLLDPPTLARKRHAVHAFISQITPDPLSGQAPVLGSATLERLVRDFEVIFL